jgi:hypothetical protein
MCTFTMARIALGLAVCALPLVGVLTPARAQLERLASTTPQERARVQTEMMTTRLGLTPDQTAKVSALNLKYAEQMEPVIKGSEGPFMKFRQMRQIDEAKEAELQRILTPDQLAQYQAARDEMRQRFERWAEERR